MGRFASRCSFLPATDEGLSEGVSQSALAAFASSKCTLGIASFQAGIYSDYTATAPAFVGYFIIFNRDN
jgi:hypothetical protein